MPPQVWTITGTDTGVGKTVLTLHLLASLQASGVDVRAFKPFASGDRSDAEKLAEMQKGSLSVDQINPRIFKLPLAPFAVTGAGNRTVPATLKSIQKSAGNASHLLLEGIGGLMTPLTRRETWLDFAVAAGGRVILVAPNRLGVLNHVLLSIRVLNLANLRQIRVALMEMRRPDLASRSNSRVLRALLGAVRVIEVPFFQNSPTKIRAIRARESQFRPLFRGLLES